MTKWLTRVLWFVSIVGWIGFAVWMLADDREKKAANLASCFPTQLLGSFTHDGQGYVVCANVDGSGMTIKERVKLQAEKPSDAGLDADQTDQ